MEDLPRAVRRLGPMEAVLERLHPFMADPDGNITEEEFELILTFVRDALTDPGASPDSLRSLIPEVVPSGLPVHDFEFGLTAGGSC